MGIKTVKFGGSSLADAAHFRRVADIVRADPARRYVVASAPGKRNPDDRKVTDLLYRCYEKARAREDIRADFARIAGRYNEIIRGLGLDCDISGSLPISMTESTVTRGAILPPAGGSTFRR